MAFNWTPVTAHADKLYELVRKFESSDLVPKLVDGNITIGMGFDMKMSTPALREQVLLKMGISSAEGQPDKAYFDRLLAAGRGSSISDLNVIMAERAANPAIRALHPNETLRTRFEFLSQDEIKLVFAEPSVQDSYFKRLLGIYPAAETDAAFKSSSESLALFSIVWNGRAPTEKLRAAIATENRAEAWYLIRYEVNYLGRKISLGQALSAKEEDKKTAGIDKGWASRRFSEAQLFGLYKGGTASLDEAKQVYGMFAQHRSEILAYERCYGIDFDGNLGSRKSNGSIPLLLAGAPAIHTAIDPAYQAVFADLAARHSDEMSGLSARNFSPVDLFIDTGLPGEPPYVNIIDATEYNPNGTERVADNLVVGERGNNILLSGGAGNDVLIAGNGSDFLYGGVGNDRLLGGKGEDNLVGGTGNDTLYGADNAGGDVLDGGEGYDTYHADTGDKLRDSDGAGRVHLGQDQLTGGAWNEKEGAYLSRDGRYRYQLSGEGLLVNGTLEIAGYRDGDLDIKLEKKDRKAPRAPDKTGWSGMYDNAQYHGTPIVLDLDGNGIATTDVGGDTCFDYDGNGFAEATGWVGAGDGLLARDRNGNGRIDATDATWAHLRLWQDRDADGYSVFSRGDFRYGSCPLSDENDARGGNSYVVTS